MGMFSTIAKKAYAEELQNYVNEAKENKEPEEVVKMILKKLEEDKKMFASGYD